jgi:hypothetical protein
MEFKGTSGTWVVSKAYKTIVDQKGFGVAQEHGVRNSEQWEANSLLISKSPELLEMLKKQIKIIDGYLQEQANNDSFPSFIIDTNQEAKQLIKEATEL